jgi:molecular chaperone HscB
MVADLNLSDSDFALFGLPERFALDARQLDEQWKALQGATHPDRFATEGAAAQRVAMQWAIRVNEAYRRLKDPLRRAEYLCHLHGADVQAHSNTAMPPAFLMQQMAWREALEEADGLPDVEALADTVAAARRRMIESLGHQIDDAPPVDWPAVAQAVRSLMFVERFGQDVDRRLDALSD